MNSLSIYGVDTALGVQQTGGNLSLYIRFLRQFLLDDTFTKLGCALTECDAQKAFLHAHTLKGLTSQLGMTALSAPCHAICEFLRRPRTENLNQAQEIYQSTLPVYRRITEDIRALSELHL